MSNELSIWRLAPRDQLPVEKIILRPAPTSLDDATQQLPGGGYTTLRTYGRFRVLRLEDHFHRLEETARLSGRPVCFSQQRLAGALHQALSVYPLGVARVRIILDLDGQPGTIYILVDTLHAPEPGDYQKGVKAVTRRMQRSNPKAKVTEFIGAAAAIRDVLPAKVNEAIMVSEEGRLLEGLSSNFFAVKSGVIWTAEQGVLSGITRSLALEAIQEMGMPLRLEGLRVEELNELEEAFLTSASRGVLPVSEIDRKRVGNGQPGPITKEIMANYRKKLAAEIELV